MGDVAPEHVEIKGKTVDLVGPRDELLVDRRRALPVDRAPDVEVHFAQHRPHGGPVHALRGDAHDPWNVLGVPGEFIQSLCAARERGFLLDGDPGVPCGLLPLFDVGGGEGHRRETDPGFLPLCGEPPNGAAKAEGPQAKVVLVGRGGGRLFGAFGRPDVAFGHRPEDPHAHVRDPGPELHLVSCGGVHDNVLRRPALARGCGRGHLQFDDPLFHLPAIGGHEQGRHRVAGPESSAGVEGVESIQSKPVLKRCTSERGEQDRICGLVRRLTLRKRAQGAVPRAVNENTGEQECAQKWPKPGDRQFHETNLLQREPGRRQWPVRGIPLCAEITLMKGQ